MTIQVASGTSTPTSTTVVDTRISMFPAENCSITSFFRSSSSLEWISPSLQSGKTDFCRNRNRSSALATSNFSDPSIEG